MNSIVSEQGEGVILRRPRSPYEIGKSSAVLKVKVGLLLVVVWCHDDCSVIIGVFVVWLWFEAVTYFL